MKTTSWAGRRWFVVGWYCYIVLYQFFRIYCEYVSVVKVKQTTTLCHAQDWIWFIFRQVLCLFGPEYVLAFNRGFCSLFSSSTFRLVYVRNLSLWKNRQSKVVHNGIRESFCHKVFVWGYFHIVLNRIVHFSLYKTFYTFIGNIISSS